MCIRDTGRPTIASVFQLAYPPWNAFSACQNRKPIQGYVVVQCIVDGVVGTHPQSTVGGAEGGGGALP